MVCFACRDLLLKKALAPIFTHRKCCGDFWFGLYHSFPVRVLVAGVCQVVIIINVRDDRYSLLAEMITPQTQIYNVTIYSCSLASHTPQSQG